MGTTDTLTGQVRFRVLKRFLRKTVLILEVEIKFSGTVDDSGGGRCDERAVEGTYWRDARTEDLVFPDKEPNE